MLPTQPVSEIKFKPADSKRLAMMLLTLPVGVEVSSGATLIAAINTARSRPTDAESQAYASGARLARSENRTLLARITLTPKESQQLSGMLAVDDLGDGAAVVDGIENFITSETLRNPRNGGMR